MQFIIGMLSTFAGLTLWIWFLANRKEGGVDRVCAHWEKAHAIAERQAKALEQIASTIQNR